MTIEYFLYILLLILWIGTGIFWSILFFIYLKIWFIEKKIYTLVHGKITKIPILMESLRKEIFLADEVFENIFALYKEHVFISEKIDIYSLLEIHSDIYKEILFIMKVAQKNKQTNLNRNFLYARDFIISYETSLKKDIKKYNSLLKKYNIFRILKNICLFWYLLPFRKRNSL